MDCLSSRRRDTIFDCDWSSDVCFFFSSRRRHTRFDCDWSSDVCSSDLLDQQYEAALADARNKRVNADRFRALAKQNASSAQEAERYETDAAVAEANLKAIETLKSYEVIRAPFTGRVTARYADPGALMQNATSAQTGALPV